MQTYLEMLIHDYFTGIDHEASNAPATPSQPFSFANRPAVSTPSAAAPSTPPAPAPVAAPVAEEAAPEPEVEPLELGAAAEVIEPTPAFAPPSAPFAPPAAVISDLTEEEELLLGGETAEAPAEPAPVRAAPRVATGGGTLFERMSGLSRGVDKVTESDASGKPGGIDIPRFLNRQNNQ